jgi:hypothetical protein
MFFIVITYKIMDLHIEFIELMLFGCYGRIVMLEGNIKVNTCWLTARKAPVIGVFLSFTVKGFFVSLRIVNQ